jgi:hypothetical protein
MKKKSVAVKKEKALYSSERSGYAVDIMPERVGASEIERAANVIPIGSARGTQVGVIPPSQRKYKAGIYESVSWEEAVKRLDARKSGKMAPIRGGLDTDNTKTASSRDPYPDKVDDSETEYLGTMDAFDPDPAPYQPQRPVTQTVPGSAYMNQRKRVTLELTDTTLSIAAIDVILSRYSVTILLPQTADGGTFLPKPGSELNIVVDDKSLACYFPGAQFDIPQLKMLGLTFIRQAEGV